MKSNETNYNILKDACEDLELEFSDEKFETFNMYKDLIKEWNDKVNLTSILDDNEIFKKHFIDSIKVYKFKPLLEAENVIDIGTGAGFPGLPMKIINDKINITLLDSLNKRINVLKDIVKKLNLKSVNLVHGRAEEYLKSEKLREHYDIAISRAVANLTVLSEICIPYVKVGGYFVALKGPNVEEEINSARNAIGTLGGKFIEVIPIKIEGSELNHNLVIIKKINPTDDKYPRKWKQISNKPII